MWAPYRFVAWLGALVAMSATVCTGCDDITVCDLPESLNECDGHDDCLLVFCGIHCCRCEMVASRRQFENTYCMVEVDEGFDRARRSCQEAQDTVCDGVTCEPGTYACAHANYAACIDGRCQPSMTPPR